jgi:hypothetical protein
MEKGFMKFEQWGWFLKEVFIWRTDDRGKLKGSGWSGHGSIPVFVKDDQAPGSFSFS